MKSLISILERLTSADDGQALAEYALILTFIAAVCVLALTALGLAISGAFGGITGAF